MDKKVLAAIVEGIVTEVATRNGLEEAEARTLVGIALKRNKEAFVKAVVVPVLTLGTPAASETPALSIVAESQAKLAS